MFCPNCGAQNPEGTVFCASCGAKVAVEQPAAQPVYQQPAQPVYQQSAQPVYQQPVYQQPIYQQPAYQQSVAPDAPMPGKALGIIGMIVGILSLIFSCTFIYSSIGLLLGIPGMILSCIAKGKASGAGRSNGLANAGFVCSLISLILGTILVLIAFIVLGGLALSY